MKSNHTALFTVLASFALTGCVTPFRAPADAAHIALERVDSPVVIVEKIWLERKHGPLAVTGYVIKRLDADDTTKTHLDVTLFDSKGGVLRSTVEHFEPQDIRRRYGRHTDGRYHVEILTPPGEVSRIEVRAHEGEHPSRG
jgi:hypothetical protein